LISPNPANVDDLACAECYLTYPKLQCILSVWSYVSQSVLLAPADWYRTQRKTRHHYDKQSTQRRNMYTLCGKQHRFSLIIRLATTTGCCHLSR